MQISLGGGLTPFGKTAPEKNMVAVLAVRVKPSSGFITLAAEFSLRFPEISVLEAVRIEKQATARCRN